MLHHFRNEAEDSDSGNQQAYRTILAALEKRKAGDLIRSEQTKQMKSQLDELNANQYKVRWIRLKNFQRVDRMKTWIRQYEDLEGYDAVVSRLEELLTDGSLAKYVSYDSQNGMIQDIQILKIGDRIDLKSNFRS